MRVERKGGFHKRIGSIISYDKIWTSMFIASVFIGFSNTACLYSREEAAWVICERNVDCEGYDVERTKDCTNYWVRTCNRLSCAEKLNALAICVRLKSCDELYYSGWKAGFPLNSCREEVDELREVLDSEEW